MELSYCLKSLNTFGIPLYRYTRQPRPSHMVICSLLPLLEYTTLIPYKAE
jgi:hypothetical protein